MLSHPVVNPHRPQPTQQLTLGSGIVLDWKASFFPSDTKSAVWLDDPSWHQPWEQFHFLPAGHFHKCQVLGNTMYGISSKPLNDLIFIASFFFFLMLFFSAIHFRLKNNNHAISQEIGLSKSGHKEAWSSGDLSRQTLTALQLLVGYPFSLRLVSASGPCSPFTNQVLTQCFSKGSLIQGNYKLNSQLLISLVNVQSTLSFDSDLKWFWSEEITAQKRTIGCPVPTHRRSECYQWSCSESLQSRISEEKGFGVSLRI